MTPARALALLVALPVVTTSCATRYDRTPEFVSEDLPSELSPTGGYRGTFNNHEQGHANLCVRLRVPSSSLRYADGTPSGFVLTEQLLQPSADGGGVWCPEPGMARLDARELVPAADGSHMLFHRGGWGFVGHDPGSAVHYGHVLQSDLDTMGLTFVRASAAARAAGAPRGTWVSAPTAPWTGKGQEGGNGSACAELASQPYRVAVRSIPKEMSYLNSAQTATIRYAIYGSPSTDLGPAADRSRGIRYTILQWSWINTRGGGVARALVPDGGTFFRCTDVPPITLASVADAKTKTRNGWVQAAYGAVPTGRGGRLYGWMVSAHRHGTGPVVPHLLAARSPRSSSASGYAHSPSAMAAAVPIPAIPANSTFANPLDIDYSFMADTPSRREAADPLIVLHGDNYYLFASKSGGYWRSMDLREWKLIVPDGLPPDAIAPAVVVLDGRMYFTSHRSDALYVTDDPTRGKWRRIAKMGAYPDPAFFVDDDGRVYLTYGASLNGAISIVELDPRNDFSVIAGPFTLMSANHANHGWERSGADNLGAENMAEGFRIAPYIEGPWMTKHNGTYYLQYSAPGTIWRSYADGVYTSTSPTGGFSYAAHSPFSYKPGGFIGGAGHGATFRDKAGNYWRVVTMIVSVKHKFERRLGIFPAGFDADGVMRTDTYLGDYPQFLPGVAPAPLENNRTGWMLVSRGKPVTVSSSVDGRDARSAVDEDIATWWSARSGASGEWLMVDLGPRATVNAIQVNFAEQDTRALGEHDFPPPLYVVEHSRDATRWTTLVDRSANTRDLAHDYAQLDQPVTTRFVRVRNFRAGGGGLFAVRDLRVFGKGRAAPPGRVSSFAVRRHSDDRSVTISWNRVSRADAYVIRFGIAPDKLYGSYELGDVDRLTMNSLNRGVTYYFTIDALNEGGVTKSGVVKPG